MPGFMYFVETEKPVTNLEQIRSFGLGYAFDEMPVVSKLERTPTGRPGVLIVDEARLSPRIGRYKPSEQTWRTFGNMAVGYYSDAKPTPSDLIRREALPGRYVTLSDGNEWLIPQVYLWEDDRAVKALPKFMDVDEHGEWVEGDVVAKYAPLVTRLTPFFDKWCESVKQAVEKGTDFTLDYSIDHCTAVIATNYCVSPRELAILQAIEKDMTPALVLFIACDLTTAIDYLTEAFSEKKSGELASDSSVIAAGHAA